VVPAIPNFSVSQKFFSCLELCRKLDRASFKIKEVFFRSRLMKTRMLPIFLVMISTVGGCAQRQTMIPRGQDPSALETAIAQRGQGESPNETVKPRKNHWGPVLKTTVRVAETCAVVCFLGVFIIAEELAKKSSDNSGVSVDGSTSDDQGGLTIVLKKIWSDDQ
jgi:hypothetical protein